MSVFKHRLFFSPLFLQMLVYYDNHEEALTVLENYAYDDRFPPNPNAYVYLYKFLKEHNSPKRKLLKVMKVYPFI